MGIPADVLEWLLEPDNPPVRYLALISLRLEVIRQKMTKEGTWILENSLNGKMLADVEEKGKPSKWLTYFGHHILMHFDPMQ